MPHVATDGSGRVRYVDLAAAPSSVTQASIRWLVSRLNALKPSVQSLGRKPIINQNRVKSVFILGGIGNTFVQTIHCSAC